MLMTRSYNQNGMKFRFYLLYLQETFPSIIFNTLPLSSNPHNGQMFSLESIHCGYRVAIVYTDAAASHSTHGVASFMNSFIYQWSTKNQH